MGKVLFFAPHSGIWVHAFPEALVAEALGQKGEEIVYITCGEVFRDQCVVMDASRIGWRSPSHERSEICRQCTTAKDLLRKEFGFLGYDLGQALEDTDLADVEKILDGVSRENFQSLTVDEVPVGRFAAYELLLRHKKLTLEFSDTEWEEYRISLRYALLALFGGRRILAREKPNQIVVYNSLYSVNRTFCMLGEQRGIPHYFLHAGGNLAHRLQTLMFGREGTIRYIKRLVDQWPVFQHRCCPPKLMRQITDHFLVLFSAASTFTFSPGADGAKRDLTQFFGILPGQRVLVATMSSYDERFAAEVVGTLPNDYTLLFPRQVDWIRALVEWVSARPDLFLVIRVHPREFPDARGGGKSEHARLLEQIFAQLPRNARVNWPSDGVSIYDLADVADVVLNAWSTAGKEMSLLGLPVVIYSPDLVFYPADLNYVGITEEEYFAQIDCALLDGWSLERVRKTYRWLAVEYGYGVIEIGDGYLQREHVKPPFGQRVLDRLAKILNPYYAQQRDCWRRPAVLANADDLNALIRGQHRTPLELASRLQPGEVSTETEDCMLRSELGRIADALYGSHLSSTHGKLAGQLKALVKDSRTSVTTSM